MSNIFTVSEKGYVQKFNEYCNKVNYESYYKHKHSFWEFFIITEGSVKHFLNEKSEILYAGDIVLIKPSDEHYFKFIADSPYEHYDLYATSQRFSTFCNMISPDCYKKFVETNGLIKIHVDKQKLKEFSSYFSNLYLTQSTYNTELINIHYYPLLCRFISEIYHDFVMNISDEDKNFYNFLSKINNINYICGDLSSILELCNYSHGHFSRLFKKKTGKTLKEYHTELKINYAIDLLKDKNKSILDISSLLGYSSLSHFIKIFKQFINCTPYQYRKMMFNPLKD